MSGFEPQTVFKPSSKFDNPKRKKNAIDWFKNQITEATERVEVIKTQLNNLPEQPGDAFSILKNFHNNYTDYDFFKWVVLYCEVKDSLIQLGSQCFVDTKEEIMQNRGIVKNNGYSSVFIDCVNFLFPRLFENMSTDILSRGHPGRNLYPSPLLMFTDIISNWTDRMELPTLFGDEISSEALSSLYGYTKSSKKLSSLDGYTKVTPVFVIPPVYKSIDELVSKYYFDDIISKMYGLYITPRFEGDPEVIINNTNYNKIRYEYNENTQRDPINIVSFLRRSDVNFNIDNNVNNFVVDVYNVKTDISDDIRYILSCAILIQLNSHYQKVINWNINLQMVPNWSVKTYPRKINTAWTFPDFPDTGSPEIKKSYTDDLNRRLMQYHENLDIIFNDKEKKENRKNYHKPAGGSKTKKQKKQRQRKQKSKRKKN
jgi:hypothetical protein